MCGICGEYSPSGVAPGDINAMLSTLVHRGPDDEGVYINSVIGLGNRRLSIIDLPHGHQPMPNEDESLWIVFNGEIYNYKQLRYELEQSGHKFRTQSDTEVILHLYEEYGVNCVERLGGMFAFAIWDEFKQRLFLARDRLGQKPLFYTQEGNRFLFASEVKAILAACSQGPQIDYESLHHYLSLRFIPTPGTMFRDVHSLPPAHILILENGNVSIRRYWDFTFNNKLDLSEDEFISGLQDKLIKTVQSHLISDVPVGAFLSGGLDSSMVVAVMAEDLGVSFKTFSIGVKEQDYNELPYARQVAERFKTYHIEKNVEAKLISLLPKIIWHLDEPSDPIAACQYHAATLASQHVKVVLGGDGGDELFAGFDRYMAIRYIDYYSHVPAGVRQNVFGPLLRTIPDNFTYKSLIQKLRWIHQLSLVNGMGERYAEATCFFRYNHSDKKQLFSPDLWKQVEHIRSSEIIVDQYNRAPAGDALDRMLYADYMTRLSEHSLMLTDRLNMANSLEARSPLVDHELVEYLAAFPSRLKIRGRTTKVIFRKLANNYLPETIVNREKQGFMLPIAYWFRTELFSFLRDSLTNSIFVREGLFSKKYVDRLLLEHKTNQVDHHVRLWMLLNLDIWHKLYIEQAARSVVDEEILAAIY